MIFVLSPAKTMEIHPTSNFDVPCFHAQAVELAQQLAMYDVEVLEQMMKIKPELAMTVKSQYQDFDNQHTLVKDAYQGLVFKHLNLKDKNSNQLAYFQKHVRILSALYGLLKGNDGICAYRLDPVHKVNHQSLYQYWGNLIAKELDGKLIVNLASKEYEKLIKPYIPKEQWIDVVFLVEKKGKLVSQATFAKMARGELLSYAIEHEVTEPQALQQFQGLGFRFEPSLSHDYLYTFVKGASLCES